MSEAWHWSLHKKYHNSTASLLSFTERQKSLALCDVTGKLWSFITDSLLRPLLPGAPNAIFLIANSFLMLVTENRGLSMPRKLAAEFQCVTFREADLKNWRSIKNTKHWTG